MHHPQEVQGMSLLSPFLNPCLHSLPPPPTCVQAA